MTYRTLWGAQVTMVTTTLQKFKNLSLTEKNIQRLVLRQPVPFVFCPCSIRRSNTNYCKPQSVEKKKYRFSLFVIFVDDGFPKNRFYFYKPWICKFYVAKFHQECCTNQCATDKLKYSQIFDKYRKAKRIILLITSLFFSPSNWNFYNIQKK